MWVFKPILKSVIWGGEKIKELKGLEVDRNDIGESWEISGLRGSESVVAEGPDKDLTISELIDRYGAALLGKKNYLKFGNSFPLLIKFIDAAGDLSIQVHPDDSLAKARGASSGKSEMWHILEATENAKIVFGLNNKISREEYSEKICSEKITDYINYINVKKGDSFMIPAGRIHSIGKGVLLAEIQQCSDITYRLFDYGRLGVDGKPRALHHEEAFEALNFEDVNPGKIEYTPKKGQPVNLVSDPRFIVNHWTVTDEVMRDYSEWDTFVIIMAINGEADLVAGNESKRIHKGETVLLPASCHNVKIIPHGDFEALETFIK
ncbi:MAG: class I mannose-6-phosphate isomerase [Muribaculaceae bacterium]|nr:class I mannose-6-phosphate isomerase [Muribaculaceae bacterium]